MLRKRGFVMNAPDKAKEIKGFKAREPNRPPDSCPIDGVSLEKLSAFLRYPEFKTAFKAWEW